MSIYNTILHEIGHYIHYRLIIPNKESLNLILKELYLESKKKFKKIF